jgi:hypothetical protein
MRCTICDNEFVAARSDAKFCSGACRKKASRGLSPERVMEEMAADNQFTRDELERQAVSEPTVPMLPDPDTLTPDGQVRQVWDKNNPIPNLEGGYFHIGQTQAEYLANLPEKGFLKNGKWCSHPETEAFHSRCLLCGEILRYIRVGDSFQKGKKKVDDTEKKL